MDIVQFYTDYNIPFQTEDHKHCRPGWVNTECPFCTGNPGLHLGFELITNHFVCWRCGWHPIIPTLCELTRLSEREIKNIIRNYDSYTPKKDILITVKKKSFRYPSGVINLQPIHKKYLTSRNFDPDYISNTFGVRGTGPISYLKSNNNFLDYRFRLIIPFIWGGKIVSFDSRDITNKAQAKYKACPAERELIPHKNILYGVPEKWGDVGLCVEGPTDVWRLGEKAFAVSGIKYKPEQVRIIAKLFKRVFVLFDGASETSKELTAFNKAKELIAELNFRKVEAIHVQITGDPGDMSEKEAKYLIHHLKIH